MEQEYIITVFSENKVGLLSQITTVFTCRDVNIESLTTSESALQGIHKFTIVVRTTPDQVDKLVRQVEKKIDVLKTFVYTPDEVVQQEIALYKVTRSRGVEQLVREKQRATPCASARCSASGRRWPWALPGRCCPRRSPPRACTA